jgi:hypothetical protein
MEMDVSVRWVVLEEIQCQSVARSHETFYSSHSIDIREISLQIRDPSIYVSTMVTGAGSFLDLRKSLVSREDERFKSYARIMKMSDIKYLI